MHKFLKELQRKKLIPVDFKLKYLPESKVVAGQLNKLALLGASFQDLGKKMSVPLQEMNAKIQTVFGNKVTAEAFDINKDGQIDVAENATAILIKDMADQHSQDEVLQTGKLDLEANDIDGTFTNDGETLFWNFLKADKVQQTKTLVTQIYNAFGLDKSNDLFAKNPNNTIE